MPVAPHLEIASEEQVHVQGRQVTPRTHQWLVGGTGGQSVTCTSCFLLQQVGAVTVEARDCGGKPPAFGRR